MQGWINFPLQAEHFLTFVADREPKTVGQWRACEPMTMGYHGPVKILGEPGYNIAALNIATT